MNFPENIIIKDIEKSTEGYFNGGLPNVSDVHLKLVEGYQLLFGVINLDPRADYLEAYKYKIQNELKAKGRCLFLAWSYDNKGVLEDALYKLSDYYSAQLDVKRMLRDIKILEGHYINLIVTIVILPIVIN